MDTYEVLCQTMEICQKKGWGKTIIIAHRDHCWRVAKTAEKLGFDPIIPDILPSIYDKKSIQRKTSSKIRFIPYEIGARIWYLFHSWI